MNSHALSQLEQLAQSVPILANGQFEGNVKLASGHAIPITDHHPIVMHTALGALVSLNIWCPGSPIAPSMVSGAKAVLSVPSQINQMKAIAKYIFDMAEAGCVGFMLQEVPDPKTTDPINAFKILNDEWQILCKHSATNINLQLDAKLWEKTGKNRSGTCPLVTKALVVNCDDTEKLPQSHPMLHRYRKYQIARTSDPANKFCIYNVHGDFAHQAAVVDFVMNKVVSVNMVCGDLNITNPSHEAQILTTIITPSHHAKTESGNITTLDGFYDPCSSNFPAKTYALADPKTAKKTVDAFAIAMQQLNYPCDKNNYLIGLKLSSNTIIIQNEYLDQLWIKYILDNLISCTLIGATGALKSTPAPAPSALFSKPTANIAAQDNQLLVRAVISLVDAKHSVMIFEDPQNKNNMIFSFANFAEADEFCKILFNNFSIGKVQNSGYAKSSNVYRHENGRPYYQVYLSKDQFVVLSQKLSGQVNKPF